MERVVLLKPPPKVAIVASENHKDGTPHIHIFLEYSTKRDVRNPLYFDHLCGQHGNIGPVKNAGRTLEYITKESNYVLFGITQATLDIIISGTSYTLGEVAAYIAENPDINEVAVRYPTHFIHYHRGLEHLCQIHRHRQSTATTPFDWDKFAEFSSSMKPKQFPLLNWFASNFKNLKDRELRARQLWLHGRTGCGKSKFLALLSAHFRAFLLPASEDYYGNYNDYDIDFCYMDEFHGQKKVTFMNSLLGGEPMNFPFKGGQYTKRCNKPVIIATNLTPEKCYSKFCLAKPLVWEAFLSRLVIVDATGIELHEIVEALGGPISKPKNIFDMSDSEIEQILNF